MTTKHHALGTVALHSDVSSAQATAIGNLSGTNSGDQTTVSGNAGTVTVADAGGDTTTFPLLGTAATGSLAPATDAGLTYDATSNLLTAAGFVGALTGNADTVTTNANLTGHITSTGNAAILGSFTVAQLSTALSDATLSGNNTGDEILATSIATGTVTLSLPQAAAITNTDLLVGPGFYQGSKIIASDATGSTTAFTAPSGFKFHPQEFMIIHADGTASSDISVSLGTTGSLTRWMNAELVFSATPSQHTTRRLLSVDADGVDDVIFNITTEDSGGTNPEVRIIMIGALIETET